MEGESLPSLVTETSTQTKDQKEQAEGKPIARTLCSSHVPFVLECKYDKDEESTSDEFTEELASCGDKGLWKGTEYPCCGALCWRHCSNPMAGKVVD